MARPKPKRRGFRTRKGTGAHALSLRRKRESRKIAKLRREGVPVRQAVATAKSMSRAGRLGPRGGYRRVRKKKGG